MYVHVDDFVVCHEVKWLADLLMQLIAAAVTKLGFIITVELCGSLRKFVGYVPTRNGRSLSAPDERIGCIARGLEFLEHSSQVYVPAAHTVLASYTWSALLWRAGLSAVGDNYNTIAAYSGQEVLFL